MRYTDLILRDFPIAVYPLDETLSGTANFPCYSITDTSDSQTMAGEYVYNSGFKAENKGVSLALGGQHATFLYENSGSHSLSIPRLNTFSSTSLYSDNTLEFWIKIDQSTDQEIKILGVDDTSLSDFGIYIYKNYIYLKIQDDVLIAAQVDSWSDQHHVLMVYSYSGMSLIVDGIKFISNKQAPLIEFENNKNFLFYGNDLLGNVQIDAIALYKYGLTETNAKRHMLYALGGGFSGAPFTRNNGYFTTLEAQYSEKVNEFLVPASDTYQNYDSENVIVGNFGMQLDNTDFIEYNNVNNQDTDFYFANGGYLNVNDASRYFEENLYVGIGVSISSSSTEEKTLMFINGTEDTGDLELLILDSNLYIRSYYFDRQTEDIPYYEELVDSLTVGDHLIAVSTEDLGYRVYIDDASYFFSTVPTIDTGDGSVVTIGARRVQQDTIAYTSNMNISSVYRLTLFKNDTEFDQVISASGGNKTNFDAYYNNMTLTYDSRIRILRKGRAEFEIALEPFGTPLWDGVIGRSSCAGLRIETLYPKIVGSEVSITYNQYADDLSVTPEFTTQLNDEIQMIGSITHDTDLTNRWIEIIVEFDSDDCLYFPPILGQISIASFSNSLYTETLPEYDVSLNYSGEEKSIILTAQDSLPYLKDQILSMINIGDFSGVNISGKSLYWDYNYTTGSLDNSDSEGLRTISFFAKKNTNVNLSNLISWDVVATTVPPSSVDCYVDGEFVSNISLSSKSDISLSDISLPLNEWHMVSLIFNTPIIHKDSTNEKPRIYFGDSTSSNVSIQHIGVSEIEFNSLMVQQLFNLFSSENRVFGVSDTTVSVTETANGLNLYTNNWITVA